MGGVQFPFHHRLCAYQRVLISCGSQENRTITGEESGEEIVESCLGLSIPVCGGSGIRLKDKLGIHVCWSGPGMRKNVTQSKCVKQIIQVLQFVQAT